MLSPCALTLTCTFSLAQAPGADPHDESFVDRQTRLGTKIEALEREINAVHTGMPVGPLLLMIGGFAVALPSAYVALSAGLASAAFLLPPAVLVATLIAAVVGTIAGSLGAYFGFKGMNEAIARKKRLRTEQLQLEDELKQTPEPAFPAPSVHQRNAPAPSLLFARF